MASEMGMWRVENSMSANTGIEYGIIVAFGRKDARKDSSTKVAEGAD